ncbi:MAG: hypothetical protein KCHDKBKB_01065 [Elusimicrobia bacterium]|nr:hypothetical protein [Elusimicrobiota bacterium]
MGRKASSLTKPEAERSLSIIIDSREQQPYEYLGAAVMALRSGDYSLFGYETKVAIERKSLQDVFNSVGAQRKRFEREVQRLAAMDYAAIVVEATLEECLTPPPYSQMNPKAVVNTLLAWSVKYRLAVFFAGNRRFGRAVTYRLLEKFFNYQQEKRSGKPQ